MPVNLVMVQNAAERRDVGIATGTLLLLRAMGAALGSTLVGALLTARFVAVSEARGLPRLDLGALRGHTALDPATRAAAELALVAAFHTTFVACAALAFAGFLTCLVVRDLPLRSSARG